MKGHVIDDSALVMTKQDTVATTLDDLEAGHELPYHDETIVLEESIPFGHKVALVPMAADETVYKYGEVIGRATEEIKPGEWVHTHNCESTRGRGDITDDGALTDGERL